MTVSNLSAIEWVQIVSAGGTVVAAVAAAFAAFASRRSSSAAQASVQTAKHGVEASKQGVKATTMMALIEAYESPTMHKDIENLSSCIGGWWTQRHLFNSANPARRNVHFYYKKAYHLWKAGLIDDEFMQDWIADTNGYPLFFSKVLPASKYIDPIQDMSRFEWAEELKSTFPPSH